uniref:UspA domain-containing protein n=1 Tax=Magallana gigas TaxID=29159 RepID=K1P9S2_MAGGI
MWKCQRWVSKDNNTKITENTPHGGNIILHITDRFGANVMVVIAIDGSKFSKEALQCEYNWNPVDGEVVRVFGHPGHQIVKKAHDVGADLVLTGSRGLGTIRRTVLGSISDYVIHHSNVPVIVCQHQ